MAEKYAGPLHESVATTKTDLWNDSCSLAELDAAIPEGAVGATTNPIIVGQVLNKEMHLWEGRIREIIKELPEGTEEDIAWQIIREMGKKGAEKLLPVFEREKGLKGRLSIQTNAKYYRNWRAMYEQALTFDKIAPNMQVKMPVTEAGVRAIEECTYSGVNINATVSFTVPQAIAVAEAVERGMKRREAEGKSVADMSPVCTLMIGRLDDWLKVYADKMGVVTTPGYIDWAGIAVMKKAYKLYNERGYRTRLLSAAFRNHLHWSETIGGDVCMTITRDIQNRFNKSDVTPECRMDNPVDQKIIDDLYKKFPDFRRAYDENGMTEAEFVEFPCTLRTLRSFLEGYDSLLKVIRNFMLRDPDKM